MAFFALRFATEKSKMPVGGSLNGGCRALTRTALRRSAPRRIHLPGATNTAPHSVTEALRLRRDNLPYEKTGKESRCIAEEIPFEIPDSWEWVRCRSLFFVNPRNTMPDDALVGFMPMPLLQDGFQNKHSFETKKWREVKNGFTHFSDGDLVIAKITPCFQNRKSAIIAGLPNSCGAGTTELHVLRDVSNCLFMPFFLWLFKTNHFIEEGKKHFSGTAGQQRIGKDFISTYLLPLPPLAEQKRIVAKIEELLPHLDEYDQAETRVEKLNAEFPEQLKKSILQWAIQGKLVPQNSDDEPVSVLLDRIRAEKMKLVKAGKIKKEKVESVIFRRDNSHYEKLNGIERCIDDEIPFEIPDSWAWARCGEIFQHNTGKALNSSNRSGRMLRYITTSNLYWDRFELENLKEMFFTDAEIEKCTVQEGDLLVCEGGDFGRAAIWNFDMPMRIQNHIHRLRSYAAVGTRFFYYLFYFYKKAGLIGGKGIGIQGLSSNALHALLFPVPPLAEQKRIVEAIELLFCKLSV